MVEKTIYDIVKGCTQKIPFVYKIIRVLKYKYLFPLFSFLWMCKRESIILLKKCGVIFWTDVEEKQRKLKDSHKGELAFIIGNGSSLKSADLDKLHNLGIYTFASNRIGLIFDQTNWRPNCYSSMDTRILVNGDPTIKNILNENLELYVFGEKLYKKLTPQLHSFHNILPVSLKPITYYMKVDKFGTNMQKYFIDGFTITYTLIQLAFYMGFKSIYLLGVDCDYSKKKNKDGSVVQLSQHASYFSKVYADFDKNAGSSYIDGMIEAYNYAEKFSKKNDFKIYNASRGGQLEAFERIDIDDFFKSYEERHSKSRL